MLRIIRGEKFSTDEKLEKIHTGLFVLLPFYLVGFVLALNAIGKNKEIFIVWLVSTISLTLLFFASEIWSKYISVKLSYLIGIIVWGLLFWLVIHLDLAKVSRMLNG